MNKRQYFVVGASYGSEPQQDRFIRDGIWALGWSEEDSPDQFGFCKQMHPGDFIAIKKRNGRGASTMTILARGVITAIIPESVESGRFVCTVHWFDKDLTHIVSLKHKGTLASVAGPFYLGDEDDRDWLVDVFGL